MNLTEGEEEQEEGKEVEERDEEEEQKEEDKEGEREEAQEEEGSNISLVDKSISCFFIFVFLSFSFILRLTLVSRTWFGSQELQAKEKCVPRAQRRTMRRKTLNSFCLVSDWRCFHQMFHVRLGDSLCDSFSPVFTAPCRLPLSRQPQWAGPKRQNH